MKSSRIPLAATLLLCLFTASVALAEWTPLKLDTVHSRLAFTASTLLFDVEGRFSDYKVLVDGDPKKPDAAKVKVEIAVSSIDTGNAKRDEHLRSPDFFDAKKFPTIRFESTKIAAQGKTLKVTGTLDMHGKQKTVTIPFKIARGKNGAGVDTVAYKGKLTLDRTAFDIGTDSIAAKISLENDVDLDLLVVTTP